MTSPIERWMPRLFLTALALLAAAAAWQCRNGWPVSADLMDLLPHVQKDDIATRAEERIQEPLSRQLIALAGHADPARAVEVALGVANEWRESRLFTTVEVEVKLDVAAVRSQLLAARIAALPAADLELLETDPIGFTTRRVRELMDPFSATSLVPTDQDWLGLTGRAQAAFANSSGSLVFDMASGTLQGHSPDTTWVLIRAQTDGDAFDHAIPERIGALVTRSRQQVQSADGDLIATGGMLYAAAARAHAIGESRSIALASIIGILLILLASLRRPRALLAFMPVLVGMLTGFVACVALFGTIHALTIVMGASLIGVAIDYPMHWLAKSYGMASWEAWPAMRRVRTGLTLSLTTSLIGYLALAFTPFPALTQTAVFSVAGLLGAYACTVCLLPAWFRNWQPTPSATLLRGSAALLATLSRISARRTMLRLCLLAAALVCASGIARLSAHDDLRLWFSLPQSVSDQAKQIGEITGFIPTSQFFLIRAPDEDALLERQQAVAERLDKLIQAGKLGSYTALSQLVSPITSQLRVRQALNDLASNKHALGQLSNLGIPLDVLKAHVEAVAALPAVTLTTALAGPLSKPWRMLWLGAAGSGGTASAAGTGVAGMITLHGLKDVDALQAVARGIPDTLLMDRSGELNAMFSDTRVVAVELKLASYVVAGLLLWIFLGRRASWRILAVPLAATVCSLAALGYMGQPLTLFSLFGLLLVTAIGVDYAIFMYEQVAGPTASLVGVTLGGATTLLSFGLLALSTTPAVSSFGVSVAIGVFFSLLWAPWVHISIFNREPYAAT